MSSDTVSKGIENRREERVSGFKDGTVFWLVSNENAEVKVKIRPVDVSKRGLGFLARQKMDSGTFYWLQVNDSKLRIEIAYCSSHLGIDDLFRCGLFLREADGDLKDICRNADLLATRSES